MDALHIWITKFNEEADLHMQLVTGNNKAFNSVRKSYGLFSGVKNYIVLAGPDDRKIREKSGYYGEKIVLEAVRLGLGTCWVGGTFSKKDVECELKPGEKIYLLITLGYEAEKIPFVNGMVKKLMGRKSKPIQELTDYKGDFPDWFTEGLQCVQKAPSAINKQPVLFHLKNENEVSASTEEKGFQDIDMGIARYHFELGAGKRNWKWSE